MLFCQSLILDRAAITGPLGDLHQTAAKLPGVADELHTSKPQ
jgi:hypothetical protein